MTENITYKIYYSSREPNGKMWCPDCVAVEAPLKKLFGQTDGPRAEIVYVGDREKWRNPKCVYRQKPLNVRSVPTVLKFKGNEIVGRIQDGDILDEVKMKKFMDS